ncbi:MAG: PAS domain-containing protein [Oscillochloris sp.]|nr:PAS domain-containing protein [Oscillochloris sp.]
MHQPIDPTAISEFLVDAFNQLPVGVAIFDTSEQFCCLHHNTSFLAITSPELRSRGSAVGMTLEELLSPAAYVEIRSIFAQVCAQGAVFTQRDMAVMLRWDPDTVRFFSWSLTPLCGHDGAVRALMASGTDITARRSAELADVINERRMQEELRTATMRERERAADLEALLYAVPAAVWIAHDPACRLITGSAVASLLLRMAPDSNLSKSVPDCQPTSHFRVLHAGREIEPHELPVQQAARGIEIRDFEEELIFDDGTRLTLLGNATPLRDEHGQVRGAVAAFLDITERKLAEQERARLYAAEQHARAEAEAALKIRDTFFSMAAHELKAPLTALLGQVQLIERRSAHNKTSWDERDQRALRAVGTHATRLNKLIDAMLDLTRIERGYLSLDRAPLDLVALTRQVFDEIQPIYPKHHFMWYGSDTPLLISGDVLRLEQVVYNLIENAVKYSPQGGQVVVTIAPYADTSLRITVCDQGIGIARSDLPYLFERFYRAEDACRRHIAGMGIGLYVVHEIVTLHGGTVSVESAEGEGSCFAVTLPLLVQ